MRKRHLFLAIALLFATRPAQAQEWLDRYMRERRAREDAQESQRRQDEQRRERPRRTPAIAPSGTPAPPANSLREVMEQEPAPSEAAPANPAPTPQEIRRAIPLEPFTPVAPSEPAAPPEEAPPTQPPTQPAPTPEIRRALPVEQPSLRTDEDAPVTPPEAPVTPTPEPEEESAEETAAAKAAAEKTRKEAAERDQATLDALDPSAQTIRLTPGAAAAPADVTQFALANSYYSRKEYDRAATEYDRYLNLYPRGADRQAALFRLAESYRQQGSFNTARQYYEALIYNFQVGDYIGPAAYRLAELYYEQEKDYTAAVSLFRKASVWVKNPNIALSAKFYAARSLQASGRHSEAIRAFEDVLSFDEAVVNPFREAVKLSLVELYADTGRTSSAMKLLLELKSETDKAGVRTEASVRLGLLYLDRKEPANAQKELVKALLEMSDDDPWRAPAEVGLLRTYYAEAKYKEALAVYDRSAKKFAPEVQPEVLLIVANSHRQLKQNAEASAIYEKLIAENPDSPYAAEAGYQQLTILYNANSKDLLPAIDAYLEKYPDKGAKRDHLTLMKAELFYKTNHFAQAGMLYRELRDSELPDVLKSEALFKDAWCQAQIGGFQEAIASFKAFLDRYPTHKLAPTAMAQRAVCHERLKDYNAALSDLDALLQRYPKAREREFALQRKGLILGQRDDNRGMVEAFRQLLKEFPESSAAGQANYWIGQAAFQTKDYRNAIEPLRVAREKDESFADRCSVSLLASLFYLEERDALTEEVERALKADNPKVRVQPQILRWLGGAYLKDPAGSEKAEVFLVRLTALGDEEAEADDWLRLGEARVRQKKWTEAEETLRTYLTKVSEPLPQARGYLLLGEAQIGAGQLTAAYETAAKVQQLQPEGRLNAQGRMLAGTALSGQEKWEEAAKTFMGISLLFDDPSITPGALEQAILAYRKMGDEKQAKKTLNTLQSRYPEYKLSAAVMP